MIRKFRLLLLVNAALLGATLVYEIIHHRSRLSTSHQSAQSTSTTINFALRQAREVTRAKITLFIVDSMHQHCSHVTVTYTVALYNSGGTCCRLEARVALCFRAPAFPKAMSSVVQSDVPSTMLLCMMQASEVLTEDLHIDHTLDVLRQDANLYRPSVGSGLQHSAKDIGLASANAAIILFCYNRCASTGWQSLSNSTPVGTLLQQSTSTCRQ